MKRVTSFELRVCTPEQVDQQSIYRSAGQKLRFNSWHKTCAQIRHQLLAPENPASLDRVEAAEIEAIAFDSRTKAVLARFSRMNLEAMQPASNFGADGSPAGRELQLEQAQSDSDHNGFEDVQGIKKMWDSVLFARSAGCDFFENRNVQDYYWELLEGARREVPFRLNYLEKRAERSSVLASSLRILQTFLGAFGRGH